MPELPEVEVLARYLAPLLTRKTIRRVWVRRPKVIAPTPRRAFSARLVRARFKGLSRRGKFLLFELQAAGPASRFQLLGHLGMTGRMYLQPADHPWPKHVAVAFDLGRQHFIYEDPRYFGRLTLELGALEKLGPEPLGADFTAAYFYDALQRSQQAVKIKLLDQSLVAGVGNIYASEALFRARISPRTAARRLTRAQVGRLWPAVRQVLAEAIAAGSTLPLNWSGEGARDGLFYFGRSAGAAEYYEEGLLVYDRAGQPCPRCRAPIKRIVQAQRSTYYCPGCQKA